MTVKEEVSRRQPVEEDMRRQHRAWRFERLGWYGLVLIVVMALAGVFGHGPLSEQSVASVDGRLQVDYQRFSRNGSVENLKIRVKGQPSAQVALLLDGPLVREATIETLQPEPLMSQSQGRALLLHLATDAEGEAALYLSLQYEGIGPLRARARVGSTSAVTFTTFIYP
ncbi:hypothetical protein G7009_20630 [Pseudomonas capeferrum]|uniref:hypothetical protein n=1 Tax=Pseudomonas capeferrum TaxID=1495066 RepID=UPI0015E3A2C4|nr:hypothetical protein [Pseudomonas capeferrum]MBA1204130.1 hypothetical protein [Pseudomonas capeferrum]